MKSSEIRDSFLRFFEERGHLIAPSDSLVPDDPTLLFTSAGMVQFKPFFLGERVPPRTRIATSQKCLRTGDLEVVGTTPFHHTFFEMLGNFSFGDYFKEEAITWAWEFVTAVLKLDPARLWASVYLYDDEAFDVWRKKIGLPENRIVRLGEKTNYWPANAPSEGPNGPCGPCSEIFFDFGQDVGCSSPTCGPDCDCGRFSEIWNLVFTQYDREDGGVLTPLPNKNIDTGAGLERLTAVIQGTKTNFETDLFLPIIEEASSITGVEYGKSDDSDIALRVIADHSRAITFCISDGVMPSNVGRGYVLRRIIRRAMLKGRYLGLEEPFLDRLTHIVVNIMHESYPELREREAHVCRTVRAEEDKFRRTLDMGLQKLNESIDRLVASDATEFPGMEAFILYDTYGFPLELTQEIAQEHGLTVDVQAFDDAMEEQRRRAREGSDITDAVFVGTLGALAEIEKSYATTDFVGYQTFSCPARVVGILRDGELADSAKLNQKVDIVLDKTPFYPEGGGQISDVGTITCNGAEFRVESAMRVGSLIIHSGRVTAGEFLANAEVLASVDETRRWNTMRNHTATHLLHRALRMMLGDHVVQSGSLVEPARFRFDFTHPVAVTPDELMEIEKIVNDEILRDDPVHAYETTLEQAKADGAMALFSEKYGGTVRVIRIGDFSKELCGGTHVSRTSQIAFFKILSESSIGAGLRRIEGVTGAAAFEYVRERERLLSQAAELLKTSPTEVPEAAARLIDSLRAAEKQIEELQRKSAASRADELVGSALKLGDVNFVAARLETGDVEVMSSVADTLADRLKSAVIVLGGPTNGKVVFVGKITPDLVKRGFHAGNLIRDVAKVTGGGGGGRPDFAQAGGKDVNKLDEALAKARELVEQQVKSL